MCADGPDGQSQESFAPLSGVASIWLKSGRLELRDAERAAPLGRRLTVPLLLV